MSLTPAHPKTTTRLSEEWIQQYPGLTRELDPWSWRPASGGSS